MASFSPVSSRVADAFLKAPFPNISPMKKTLFLTAVLCGSIIAPAVGDTVDVFVPQSIICVQQGETVTLTSTLTAGSESYKTCTAVEGTESMVGEILSQEQAYHASNNKRSAIVKDGQGELAVTDNLCMQNALLVREGTMKITDATIRNAPVGVGGSGNNLSVGGRNAHLILDHATYTTIREDGTDPLSTSSVSIGSLDGDATVDLLRQSTLHTRQTIFLGGHTAWFPPADPKWESRPHKGGSYAYVDSDPTNTTSVGEGNVRYNALTEYAGFENEYQTALGTRFSTVTVNVKDGSLLESGSGFYIENATLNINAATVNTGKNTNADNVFVGGGIGTRAVLNITNGGVMNVLNNQQFNVSSNSSLVGNDSRITISGDGSQLNLGTYALFGYFSKDVDSTSAVFLERGGALNAKSLYLGSSYDANGNHSITLTKGGLLNATNFITMFSGSTLTVDAESTVTSPLVQVDGGAVIENNGTIEGEIVVYSGGRLKGSGTMGATTLKSGANLIVGNSPGKQTYTGDLIAAGIVNFSVDELLYPQQATDVTAGWDSGCYSVIDMQNHALQLNGSITITLSATAAEQVDGVEHFELVFAENIGNTGYYTQDVLTSLSKKTYININGQSEYLGESKLYDAHYEIKGNDLVWVYGEVTPEPTTVTLSLLALAGLAMRRRRK